jgi:hypothetical protein
LSVSALKHIGGNNPADAADYRGGRLTVTTRQP